MGAIQYGYKVPMIISSRPMACPEPNLFKFIKITELEEQKKLLEENEKVMDVRRIFSKPATGLKYLKPVPTCKTTPSNVTLKRPLGSVQEDVQPKRVNFLK